MKKLACILMLFCIACKSKPSGSVKLSVVQAQGTVEANGLTEASLYGLKSDSISTQAWQTLMIVCKMPADTELRSAAPVQPGAYQLTGNKIVFKPDTPFVKGTVYFARYFHFDDGLTSSNMITEHRRPGQTPFTELIFRY